MAKPSHVRTPPAPPLSESAGKSVAGGPCAAPGGGGYYKGDEYRAEESVGYLMKQMVDLLSRAIDARMAEHSLTDAQWRPLMLLLSNSQVTPTQMARKVGCDTGATTRMLDRLEDKGLLRRVRSTDDRRVQFLELTPEGHKAAAVVPLVITEVLNAHLADLTHPEIDQLRNLLQRMVATGRREAALREAKDDKEGHA
jgi:DNA-binding MarR family transcriptional regulator